MRQRVVRISGECAFKMCHRLAIVSCIHAHAQRCRAQKLMIRIRGRRLPHRALHFHHHDIRHKAAQHGRQNLILCGERVAQLPLEPVGPHFFHPFGMKQ